MIHLKLHNREAEELLRDLDRRKDELLDGLLMQLAEKLRKVLPPKRNVRDRYTDPEAKRARRLGDVPRAEALQARADMLTGWPHPKPSRRTEKRASRSERRDRRAGIRTRVFERATVVRGAVDGDWPRCEGPALHDPSLGILGGRCAAVATDLSHLFGKGKGRLPESIRTCAAWCRDCHKAFGANRPSAKAWWTFIAWWLRSQGFLSEAAEAENRAAFVETRSALPAAPRLQQGVET